MGWAPPMGDPLEDPELMNKSSSRGLIDSCRKFTAPGCFICFTSPIVYNRCPAPELLAIQSPNTTTMIRGQFLFIIKKRTEAHTIAEPLRRTWRVKTWRLRHIHDGQPMVALRPSGRLLVIVVVVSGRRGSDRGHGGPNTTSPRSRRIPTIA